MAQAGYNPNMDFSSLLMVRQHFQDRSLQNIPDEVWKELNAGGFGKV